MDKNTIKVYTTSNGAELNISAPSSKQIISATNNRAQYFAEQAKKYRDEAKLHRDNAKYYSEQNADVTTEYIDNVRMILEEKIVMKQDKGNYALKEELPAKLSELENDSEYVNKSELEILTEELKLPSKEGFQECFLMTDGENESWVGINSFQLFDTKIVDKKLSYEESRGWALQGTYVYKEAIAGSHYGYPDFYNRCLEEKENAIPTEIKLGNSTITMYINANGHQFYDIADLDVVDSWFNTYGAAWFYGIDIQNKRIRLPRNNFFAINGISDNAPVAGTGKSMGFLGGENGDVAGGLVYTSDGFGVRTGMYGADLGEKYTSGEFAISYTAGLTTDSSKSGVVAQTSNLLQKDDSKYLYVCVGNTTNYTGITDVINQGMDILEQVSAVAEDVESRVKSDGSNADFLYVKETYVNGFSWYRIWSDGWCEQGGQSSVITATTTITLLKDYKNTKYNLYLAGTSAGYPWIISRTTQSFVADTSAAATVDWKACGYIL